MHWNYRVVKKIYSDGSKEYSVREVHYNDAGEICGYTADPVDLANETLEDLKEYIQWCLNCLDKPILEDGKVEFASDGIIKEDLEMAEEFDNIEDFLDDLGKEK
jgi:hypothetical protein